MTAKSLTGKRVLEEIKKCGITHIVWLPDSRTKFMYEEMMGQHDITLVPVCREGEAVAIAVGLRLGGKNPIVLHQDTGFYESGDSVRALGLDLELPLLLLLGYHGSRDVPTTNSAAVFLEPTLDAWGIKHYLVMTDDDAGSISTGYEESQRTKKPVAILIRREGQ